MSSQPKNLQPIPPVDPDLALALHNNVLTPEAKAKFLAKHPSTAKPATALSPSAPGTIPEKPATS